MTQNTFALATTSFQTLDLNPATLANLEQLGYTEMTPIQAASLPAALAGKDLIAQAKKPVAAKLRLALWHYRPT